MHSTLSTHQQGNHFAAALNSLAVHVAVISADGTIVAVNDAWRRFAAENAAADHPSLVEGANYLAPAAEVDDEDARNATLGVQQVLGGDLAEFRLEYPCHSPSELRWFELRATPLRDGELEGAVVVHSTITDRKLADERLAFLAHHDELTGLSNRRRIMEVLTDEQPTGTVGTMLLDLDHFKAINDTHGHAAGNDVLCAVADAINAPLASGSLAGRHGGDEFSIIVFDTDSAELELLAHEVNNRVMARLSRLPVAAGATVSIGATMVDPDEPLAEALERADQALYAVKRDGRGAARVA